MAPPSIPTRVSASHLPQGGSDETQVAPVGTGRHVRDCRNRACPHGRPQPADQRRQTALARAASAPAPTPTAELLPGPGRPRQPAVGTHGLAASAHGKRGLVRPDPPPTASQSRGRSWTRTRDLLLIRQRWVAAAEDPIAIDVAPQRDSARFKGVSGSDRGDSGFHGAPSGPTDWNRTVGARAGTAPWRSPDRMSQPSATASSMFRQPAPWNGLTRSPRVI
jgi:hypothetical protein